MTTQECQRTRTLATEVYKAVNSRTPIDINTSKSLAIFQREQITKWQNKVLNFTLGFNYF